MREPATEAVVHARDQKISVASRWRSNADTVVDNLNDCGKCCNPSALRTLIENLHHKDFGATIEWKRLTPNDLSNVGGPVMRAVCRIIKTDSSGHPFAFGTGWLIREDLVATCAHGVIETSRPLFVQFVFDGLTISVHGKVPSSWSEKTGALDDAAVLVLDQAVAMAPLSFGAPSTGNVYVFGHPGVEQPDMVRSAGTGVALPSAAPGHMRHVCDTAGGHSGSPVIHFSPSWVPQAVGLHVGGYGLAQR